jgi:hypothetical protein
MLWQLVVWQQLTEPKSQADAFCSLKNNINFEKR